MGGIGIIGSALFAFVSLSTTVFSLFQAGFGQRPPLAPRYPLHGRTLLLRSFWCR
jgi:hypothetical protein